MPFDECPVFIDNPQGTLMKFRFIKKSLAEIRWGVAPEISYSYRGVGTYILTT